MKLSASIVLYQTDLTPLKKAIDSTSLAKPSSYSYSLLTIRLPMSSKAL